MHEQRKPDVRHDFEFPSSIWYWEFISEVLTALWSEHLWTPAGLNEHSFYAKMIVYSVLMHYEQDGQIQTGRRDLYYARA